MAAGPDAEADVMDWSHRFPPDAPRSGPLRAYSARCSVPTRGAEAPSDLRTSRISRPITRVGRLSDGRHPESVQNTQSGIGTGSSGRPNRIFGPAVRGFQFRGHGVDAAQTFYLLLAQGRKSFCSGRQHRRGNPILAPASGPVQGKLPVGGCRLQRRSRSGWKLSLRAQQRANSRLCCTGFVLVQKIQG